MNVDKLIKHVLGRLFIFTLKLLVFVSFIIQFPVQKFHLIIAHIHNWVIENIYSP